MNANERIEILRDALKAIAGGADTGRWIDQTTYEAVDGGEDDNVAGAEWELYTLKEQNKWVKITAQCALKALERTKS